MKGAMDAQRNFYLPEAGFPGHLNFAGACTFNAVLQISPA
jgi:hypothetical protein